MKNDSMQIISKIDLLQKKIEECDAMSFRMKAVTCGCLLVDLLCAKKGDNLIVILTIAATVLFWGIDIIYQKKKQLYRMHVDQIRKENDEERKTTQYSDYVVKYPVIFYVIMAAIMIGWFIKIR